MSRAYRLLLGDKMLTLREISAELNVNHASLRIAISRGVKKGKTRQEALQAAVILHRGGSSIKKEMPPKPDLQEIAGVMISGFQLI